MVKSMVSGFDFPFHQSISFPKKNDSRFPHFFQVLQPACGFGWWCDLAPLHLSRWLPQHQPQSLESGRSARAPRGPRGGSIEGRLAGWESGIQSGWTGRKSRKKAWIGVSSWKWAIFLRHKLGLNPLSVIYLKTGAKRSEHDQGWTQVMTRS